MKRVTQKDIAEKMGLTVNSVSHALNDKSDISPATKEKVLQVAKELGYVPNFAASALKKGRTRTVAVVFDNLFNPYYNIMMHYLATELHAASYDFLTMIEDSDRLSLNTFNGIVSRNVDGILSFLEPDAETGGVLEKSAIPVTMIGRYCNLKKVDYIYADDVRGGFAATEYLINKGARHLHYLADRMTSSCARERYRGFMECVEQYGVPHSYSEMEDRPYFEVVTEVIEKYPLLDGFVCFNDHIAVEAQYAASLKNPAVKVVGFDNIKAEFKVPGVYASVAIDKEELARRAVRLLLDRIEGNYSGASKREILPVRVAEYQAVKL